ncbi:MAG: T9SS type A sorting domain-containing protein [Salibacteraceae bacterium]
MNTKVLPALAVATLLLTAETSFAQISLNAANSNPSVGMVVTIQAVNGSGFNPGTGGANNTWDFSSMVSTGSSSVTMAATTNSDFPNSNITWDDPNNAADAYLNYGSNSQAWYGSTGLAGTVIYSDPQDLLRLPFFYQDSYSDTYSGTVLNAASQTLTRSGTTTVTADGYGDIVLPHGTVSGVLRVKTEMIYDDELSGLNIADYEETRFQWYDASSKFPVCTYVVLVSKLNGVTLSTIETLSYLDQNSVSVAENSLLATSLKVFPNPAKAAATVAYELENTAMVNIVLRDLAGREVQTVYNGRMGAGIYQEAFSVESLPKGMYLLHLQIDGETTTRKVTVGG